MQMIAECVRRTLVAALEAGQFPALCPGCRADGDTGMIDESALGWLASRGVIDKSLLQRLLEQRVQIVLRHLRAPRYQRQDTLDPRPTESGGWEK